MSDFFSENTEKPKKSIVELYEEKLFKKPTKAPEGSLCALFLGENGSAKSGVALSTLTEKDIKEGKKIVVVDLDSGNLPLIIGYHLKEYLNGNIAHEDPLRSKENEKGELVPDYDKTIHEMMNIGFMLQQKLKEHKVKLVVLDGLSKLKSFAEFKMREDHNLGSVVNTSFDFKYYKERRKTFGEVIDLYKSLPVDKIFIGLPEFIIPKVIDPKKPPSALKADINAAVFQRVRFRTEEDTKGNTKWLAKVDKNKLDLAKIGKEVCFAENKTDKKGNKVATWNPERVFDLLKP